MNFLQAEAKEQGFSIDSEGGGGYSSLHIRRGDFQYKKMRVSGEEWYVDVLSIHSSFTTIPGISSLLYIF